MAPRLHPAEHGGSTGVSTHPIFHSGKIAQLSWWGCRQAQLHIRFLPGAKWTDDRELDWIYAPTKKKLGIEDGANAPLERVMHFNEGWN